MSPRCRAITRTEVQSLPTPGQISAYIWLLRTQATPVSAATRRPRAAGPARPTEDGDPVGEVVPHSNRFEVCARCPCGHRTGAPVRTSTRCGDAQSRRQPQPAVNHQRLPAHHGLQHVDRQLAARPDGVAADPTVAPGAEFRVEPAFRHVQPEAHHPGAAWCRPPLHRRGGMPCEGRPRLVHDRTVPQDADSRRALWTTPRLWTTSSPSRVTGRCRPSADAAEPLAS